jgi:hypothetical protein
MLMAYNPSDVVPATVLDFAAELDIDILTSDWYVGSSESGRGAARTLGLSSRANCL